MSILWRRLIAVPAALVLCGLPVRPSHAQIAGEWTHCIGRIPGQKWNIVNGQSSEALCTTLGKICVNDARYAITYYPDAIIINAPYIRCTATLPNPPSPPEPPSPNPLPSPETRANQNFQRMLSAIKAGNPQIVANYLKTGEFDSTWAERWVAPRGKGPAVLTKTHWLEFIFRDSSVPSKIARSFLDARMDVTIPNLWQEFAFSGDYVGPLSGKGADRYLIFSREGPAFDQPRKEEILLAVQSLADNGFRPAATVSPSRDFAMLEIQLIGSCVVHGFSSDSQFSLRYFNFLENNLPRNLLESALAQKNNFSPPKNGSTADVIRAQLDNFKMLLAKPLPKGLSPRQQQLVRTRQRNGIARYTACLPLASEIDRYLAAGNAKH
jgi:hypothetical protein